jgi:hypothetical protein
MSHTTQLVKETLKNSLEIMVSEIRKNQDTETNWNNSKVKIMELGMTEAGAITMMRAVMSLVNGKLHPCFK